MGLVCGAGSKTPSPPSVAEDGGCWAFAAGTVEATGGEDLGSWGSAGAVGGRRCVGDRGGDDVMGERGGGAGPTKLGAGVLEGRMGEVETGVLTRCLQVGLVIHFAWVLVVADVLYPE